jgi:uncharacterized protein
VLAVSDGWRGVRALFARIVRGGIGLRWYAVVFGLPFALCLIAACLTNLFGFHSALPASNAWRELPERFIFIFLFTALGESRAGAGSLCRSFQRRFSFFGASVILAFFWALWHAPLFGNEFAWNVVPAFLVSVVGATFVQTWIFNRTRGSVFAPMLLHATVNGERRIDVASLPRKRRDRIVVDLRDRLVTYRANRDSFQQYSR